VPPAPEPAPTLVRDTVVAVNRQVQARGQEAAGTVGQVDPAAGRLVSGVLAEAGTAVDAVAALLP
jgi:hypothetical protein